MRDEIDKTEDFNKKLRDLEILKEIGDPSVNVIVYETIDSTNTEARRLLERGMKPPFVLVSDYQSAGRGRHGNTFFSPEKGLYYTLVISPKDMSAAIARTTIAAAVALQEAILETAGIECGIKWVNDLYLNGKKVAGILCEAPHQKSGPERIIIGIGVNIAQKEFPAELEGKAGSLNCPDLDRNRLAGSLTKRLLLYCENLRDPHLLEAYRSHSFLLGRQVSFLYNGKPVSGRAVSINEDGNLLVEGEDQTYVLSSGEVSLSLWK